MSTAPALAPIVLSTPVSDCCSGVLPTAQHRADYANHGWTIIRGALRADCVAGMRDEVLEVVKARNMPDSYLAQAQEYLAGGYLDKWVNSPGLAAIASSLLEGQAHVYMAFTAVKGPKQGAFGFHQDNNYTPQRAPGEFRWGLNCWLALVPMQVANGALRVVPDTHRQGVVKWRDSAVNTGHREVAQDPNKWVDAVMQPGDICIFDRNTVHGSGPNVTDQPRVAYAVQFHRHDTEALIDDTWELLTKRPKYQTGPRPQLTNEAQRTE